jgi:hypothetical protein
MWDRGLAFLIVLDRPTRPRQVAYPGHPDAEVVVAFCGKELTSAAVLTTAWHSNEERSRLQEAVLENIFLLGSQIA